MTAGSTSEREKPALTSSEDGCALRILLHVCCAPCATHAVETLKAGGADVTLFFSNSNIHSEQEYSHRLAEAEKLSCLCGCPLVADDYDHDAWLRAVAGLEGEPEKGARCPVCFRFNMSRASVYAREHGYDGFATTLTTSPHKRSADIFRIGRALGNLVELDFKKCDGFRHSVDLSRQYGLYRQRFCGCEFSRRD